MVTTRREPKTLSGVTYIDVMWAMTPVQAFVDRLRLLHLGETAVLKRLSLPTLLMSLRGHPLLRLHLWVTGCIECLIYVLTALSRAVLLLGD